MSEKQRVLVFSEQFRDTLARDAAGRFEVAGPSETEGPDWFERHGAGLRLAVARGNDKVTKRELDHLPDLEHIQVLGAGMDGIDLAELDRRGISIVNSSAVHAAECADFAVAIMMAAWRGVLEGDRWVRDGGFARTGWRTWGRSLRDARLGIVGLGHIGQEIARRAEVFGMDIAWWGPRPKPDLRWPHHADLAELASWADIVMVVVKAHDETRGLISREIIEAVGQQGMIVNISRGFVVDEEALIAALKDGRLGYAALDVFDPEPTAPERWQDVPNTLLTPHIAGGPPESLVRLHRHTLEQVCAFLGV